MASPELSIELTANIDNLKKNLREAAKDVNNFSKNVDNDLNKNSKSVIELEGQLNYLKEKLKKSSNSSPSIITGIKNEIDKTSKSLKEAQEAANKLNKEIVNTPSEKLKNLKEEVSEIPGAFNQVNEAGQSTESTLEDVASSTESFISLLSGGGGLKIAIAAATTAVLIYNEVLKANETQAEATARINKELNKELISGNANVETEIINLKSLLAVARDESISKNGRLQAVEKINDIMPDYLGDITLEGINSKRTTDIVDKYTKALFLNAKIKAASSLIEKEFTKQFEAQNKTLAENATGFQKAGAVIGAFGVGLIETGKNFSEFYNGAGIFKAGKAAVDAYGKSIDRLGSITLDKTIDKSTKAIDFFNKIITDTNKELAISGDLFNETENNTDKIGDVYKKLANELKSNPLEFGITKIDLAEKNIASYQNAINSLIQLGFNPATKAIQLLIDKQNELAANAINKNQLAPLKYNLGIESPTINVDVKFPNLKEKTNEVIKELKDKFQLTNESIAAFIENTGLKAEDLLKIVRDYSEGLKDTLSGGALSLLADFGSSIGEAFANGASVVDAAAGSILGSIGSILIKFGELTLAAGIAATALGKALSNPLNPANAALAIGAGVALIAIGAAVRGFSQNIGKNSGDDYQRVKQVPGFASGVNNFSGGIALVGERGPELVNLPTGADVIPNDRSMDILNSRQDSNIILNGDLSVGLDQLYFALKRTEKRLERRG